MGSSFEMTGFVRYINDGEVLGAFAKMRKEIIGFVMFLCPSVRPHGTALLLLDVFS
jgi:hypothetical protein